MGRALRLTGTALAIAFAGVLVWRGAGEMPPLDLASGQVWLGLAAGWAFYVASQLVAASAWRATLQVYDVTLPCGRAESQLLISQIGKYLPGGVAQYLGRAAIARADGAGTAAVAGALVLEVGVVLAAAALALAAVADAMPAFLAGLAAGLPGPAPGWSALLAAGLLATVAAVQALLWRRAGRPPLVAARLVLPVALHLANFVVLGLSLWAVTQAVAPGAEAGVAHCVAIFTVAWVAGFLMPGAPGGAGVRDGIIAIGLELFVAPGTALACALAHRAASVLGDAAILGIGLAFRRACGPVPAMAAK